MYKNTQSVFIRVWIQPGPIDPRFTDRPPITVDVYRPVTGLLKLSCLIPYHNMINPIKIVTYTIYVYIHWSMLFCMSRTHARTHNLYKTEPQPTLQNGKLSAIPWLVNSPNCAKYSNISEHSLWTSSYDFVSVIMS